MFTATQIQSDVYEMIRDVLAVDAAEIQPDARFFHDLGGESIDLLELSFHCEKRYGRKMEFQKLFALGEPSAGGTAGPLAGTLASLKDIMPSLDLSQVQQNPTIEHMRGLLTVQALFEFVRYQIALGAPDRGESA